jgi:lipopolysaccharide export system permease protein
MKVLSRYIGAEVVLRALLILGLVSALMLLAKGLDYLEEMAQGEIPAQAVLALLGLAVPKIMALALPLALFFGLLTTVSRLYMDSEMDAMGAAGVGLYNLLPLVAILALVGAVLEAGLTLWGVPKGEARMAQAMESFQQQALTSVVRAGEFNEFPGGRMLFFERRDGQGRLKQIFFHDPGSEPAMTLTAERGRLSQDESGRIEAVFEQGKRFQARFGAEGYGRVMHFDRYRIRRSLGEGGTAGVGREGLATAALVASAQETGRPELRSELYRRFAMPLSLPVLLLLAIPLGVENRRSGSRSYGVLWGALLVLAYHNGLILIEEWAQRGTAPAHWLLWVMPLVTTVLAAYMLRQRIHSQPLLPPLFSRVRR